MHRDYTIFLHSFVCDAPAKAMLKNIKSHSGYYGCEKCSQEGEWHGKVTYPKSNSPLRTDVLFHEMANMRNITWACRPCNHCLLVWCHSFHLINFILIFFFFGVYVESVGMNQLTKSASNSDIEAVIKEWLRRTKRTRS